MRKKMLRNIENINNLRLYIVLMFSKLRMDF